MFEFFEFHWVFRKLHQRTLLGIHNQIQDVNRQLQNVPH